MERAKGIGGVFFRARDPEALCEWYARHLGIELEDFGGTTFRSAEGAATVWAIFPADTAYWPHERQAMINYRVDDLDAMLEQLRAAGVEVDDGVEEHQYRLQRERVGDPSAPAQGTPHPRPSGTRARKPRLQGAGRHPRDVPAGRALSGLRGRALRDRPRHPPPRGARACAPLRPARHVRALPVLPPPVEGCAQILGDVKAGGTTDSATLSVAVREIRNLIYTAASPAVEPTEPLALQESIPRE